MEPVVRPRQKADQFVSHGLRFGSIHRHYGNPELPGFWGMKNLSNPGCFQVELQLGEETTWVCRAAARPLPWGQEVGSIHRHYGNPELPEFWGVEYFALAGFGQGVFLWAWNTSPMFGAAVGHLPWDQGTHLLAAGCGMGLA